MAEVKIVGTTRTEFGKGASRRARRDGLVPAVIYGHGEKPLHITLPAKELGVALKQSNVLLDITIDGKNELTLPKVIVRDFLKQILEHIDLVLVRRGEKVTVAVPVHPEGKHDPDGILEHVAKVDPRMVNIFRAVIEILRVDENADALFWVFDYAHRKRTVIRKQRTVIN